MAKLILAVTLTGAGAVFWHYPVSFSLDMETLFLAPILWLLALLLLLSFLLELSTQGPLR